MLLIDEMLSIIKSFKEKWMVCYYTIIKEAGLQ
jgi:hypothetical protein